MNFFLVFLTAELLNFSVYFGNIRVGSCYLKLDSVRFSGDSIASRATLVTRTEGLFSKIFPVYDSISSTFHSEEFYTIQYERFISEGSYRAQSKAIYAGDTVFYSDGTKIPIGKKTLDPLSIIYFLRSKGTIDSLIYIDYHVDKKSARVALKTEKLRVRDKDLVKVYVDLRDPNVSKTPGETTYIFESGGKKRPLELHFKSSFGILKARLQ